MRTYDQYCPAARALDVVGDRWTLLIVRELLNRGAARYTDLKDGLPGIATNLLADRLREHEDNGIITREAAPPPIATTLFRLTPRGEALQPVLTALGEWGMPLLEDASEDAANCGGCGNACSLQGDAPGDHLVCDGGNRPKNHCGCSNNKQCRIGSAGGSCNGATGRCSCSGQVCHEGEACISGGVGNACSCNGNAGCAAGEACCQTPTGCFDLLSNPSSCGACGHVCPTGFACVAGACACTADSQCNAGSPGAVACTSGVCACGGAGCAAGQRCQPDGACG